MRGTAVTGAVRRFWKIEEMGFVIGEVEEGAWRKHEAWELGWEMERGLGKGGSPASAYGSETQVIGIDGEEF